MGPMRNTKKKKKPRGSFELPWLEPSKYICVCIMHIFDKEKRHCFCGSCITSCFYGSYENNQWYF